MTQPRRTFAELLAAAAAATPTQPAAKCRCRRCNTLFVMNGHYQSAQTLAQRRFLVARDAELGKLCRDCVPVTYDELLALKAAAAPTVKPEAEATGTDDVASPF